MAQTARSWTWNGRIHICQKPTFSNQNKPFFSLMIKCNNFTIKKQKEMTHIVSSPNLIKPLWFGFFLVHVAQKPTTQRSIQYVNFYSQNLKPFSSLLLQQNPTWAKHIKIQNLCFLSGLYISWRNIGRFNYRKMENLVGYRMSVRVRERERLRVW